MKIEITFRQLTTLIEEYKKCKLVNNKEMDVKDLGIKIPTPNGIEDVNQIIKKFDLPMLKVTLSNGYFFKGATTHIVQQNNADVYLKNLKTGDKIDHRSEFPVFVKNVEQIENEDCFDISINDPHVYYDKNGVVHHNTIVTATMAKICEKYGRTITIVPNKSLVEQTEEDFVNCGLDVGVYYGDRKNLDKTHTICTWQSLNILDKKSKEFDGDIQQIQLAELLDNVQCVIVDECFSGDSKVLTPNGYVDIKDIKEGDSIINYSETSKQFKVDTVVKQHTNLTNSLSEKMYELEFDNGIKIKVTGNHKFLTDKGWIRADNLTEHHKIVYNKT